MIGHHQSPVQQLPNSLLLVRWLRKSRFSTAAATATAMESSDHPQPTIVHNFHDLESFQKAQLLNKLWQTWVAEKNSATATNSEEREPPITPARRRVT